MKSNFAAMLALMRKEIRGFLSLLIGYIVISVFLLLMGLFLWVFPFNYNIPETGYARLDPLFDLAPFVFLFLIPAITMRSFAEEKRTGTIELLFTRPLSDMQIILGKYSAGFVLVLFALIPTLIYYISVSALGDPPGNIDHGGVWGSYIGLFFIGALFVAIGLFSSSLTQNQVVAFIIAVFLCFFMYLGFEFISSYSNFGSLDTFVRNLGIYEHYQSIKRGVVDTRDVIYFVSAIVVFLFATRSVLELRHRSNWSQLFISLGIVVLINFMGGFRFMRFDLTTDKIHSLSPTTIRFLEKKIKGNSVFVKIYLTGKLPADLKYLEKSIKEKLMDMRAYTGDDLQFEFIDPNQGKDETEKNEFRAQLAYQKKIKVAELETEEDGAITRKFVFPGAVVSFNGGPEERIQFFAKDLIYKDDPMLRALVWSAVDQLEYRLVDGIRKAQEPIRPRIAILQGHGEANANELGIVVNALSEFYEVGFVTIDEKIHALDGYSMLLLCAPDSVFSEKDKFVIDQFVMRGGKSAWFIDPLDVRLDTLLKRGQTFALTKNLHLDDQLFTYGVRINANLVLDARCAPVDIPGYPGQYALWPYYPLLLPSQNHPITRNINPIHTEYASGISTVGDTNQVKKTVLLQTSEKSVIYNAPVRVNYGIVNIDPFNAGNLQPPQPIGVLLEGKFKSVFKNRLPESFVKSSDYKTLDESRPTRMLVVSDANIIVNKVDSVYNEQTRAFVPRFWRLDKDPYHVTNRDGSPKYVYGNLQFFMNAVDYLLGDASLIGLRQRTVRVRKLDTTRVTAEKGYWQLANTAFPILVVIAFGVLQHYLRKRKYAKR